MSFFENLRMIINFMPKTCIIAFDIGATKIHAGLVNETGKILTRIKIPTEAKKVKAIILKNIFKAINTLLIEAEKRELKPRAIGLGIAGQVNYAKGIFMGGPNFSPSFRRINLKNIIKKKYRLNIFLDNDARLFTLGEAYFGAGRNYKNIIGLTLGTGIGGGLIINKKLYRGLDNIAGEFGHMIVSMDNWYACSQFSYGEALASGSAMTRMYRELTGKNIDALELEIKIKAHEQTAKKVLAVATLNLSYILANLVNIINPEIIILGGGLIRFTDYWQPAIKASRELNPFALPLKTKIIRAKLGDDANLLGAYLLVKNLSV